MRRDAAAIGLAVGVYAVSFGVLSVNAGLTVAQTCAISALWFTGGSQFAFVGVLGGGGSVAAAAVPALLLAARNGVYGLLMAPSLSGGRLKRAAKSQLVIDESTAMAQAHPEQRQTAFLTTGLAVFACWNLGTLIGALVGEGIGDPEDFGLDAMFPAAFLALLAPQLRRPDAPQAAIIGALVAIVLVPFVPAGVPILAALLGLVPAIVKARRA